MTGTRKLAATLVADVVGYSRLAGADEERTLARLRGLRSDLMDPAIAAHHGRIVKRTGDGSIVEFRSAVDAARCAIEVQTGMIERNAGVERIAVSSSESAFISAMWSRRATATLWATGSTSPRGWKGFANRTGFVFPPRPTNKCVIGSRSGSSIWAKRSSRTSPGRCAPML